MDQDLYYFELFKVAFCLWSDQEEKLLLSCCQDLDIFEFVLKTGLILHEASHVELLQLVSQGRELVNLGE